MKKRVFITGTAGFIGFHLAQAFHSRGDQVLGFDNFNDYYSPLLKQARVSKLKQLGIDTIEGDLNNASKLREAVDQYNPTHFVHLAAQAGVRYSLVNPQAYIDSNITGFSHVLEICKERPQMPLTYASSSSVYGTNTKVPFSVTDRTDNQASFYGVTKKSNELMAYTYHHLYKIKTTGLRFFTVYGPWGRPDMAYYSFAKLISEGKQIDVYNHGNMQRDFTYVDDIVDGIVASVDLEAANEIFNLGNHHPEPLAHLIELIEQGVGKKAVLNYLPMQAGDVERTYADISHSQKLLGFSPKVSLAEGMGKFLEWFKSYK